MTVKGDNYLISFGQDINNEIDNIQGRDIVITKEILKKTYPMQLNIKTKDDQDLTLNLRYHFCQDLHKEVSREEYDAFTLKENFDEDERVFFVKGGVN